MLPGRDLSALLPFGVSVTFSLLAWGAVAINYIWPRISKRALHSAVRPLLHLHLFRFIGLAFIVPGVVGVNLESRFSGPAAYGDLIATILAWMAILIGTGRYSRAALWIFNLWGCGDLLFAFYQGTLGVGIVPGALGAAWYIPTVFVPLLLWCHALIFALLLQDSRSAVTTAS
jgi:hypothetical protein